MIDPLASLLRCGHILAWFPSLPLTNGPLTQAACRAFPQTATVPAGSALAKMQPLQGSADVLTVLQALKYFNTSKQHPLLQVVEESDSSAIFTIGMVVVYGECTISEARPSAI